MPTIGLLQSNPSLLNCPDRVIFHGHLMRYATPKGPLTRPSGLGGVKLAQVVLWLGVWRQRLIDQAHTAARRRGRPILRLKSRERQEDEVKKVPRQRPVRKGWCVWSKSRSPFGLSGFRQKGGSRRAAGAAVGHHLLLRLHGSGVRPDSCPGRFLPALHHPGLCQRALLAGAPDAPRPHPVCPTRQRLYPDQFPPTGAGVGGPIGASGLAHPARPVGPDGQSPADRGSARRRVLLVRGPIRVRHRSAFSAPLFSARYGSGCARRPSPVWMANR